jgi:hypothetical protein
LGSPASGGGGTVKDIVMLHGANEGGFERFRGK